VYRFLPTDKAFDDALVFFNTSNLTVSQGLASTVMNGHISPGALYSLDFTSLKSQITLLTSLTNSTITADQNGFNVNISGPGNKVSGKIIDADFMLRGGVLHWIDLALLPSTSILQHAATNNGTVTPVLPELPDFTVTT
jgi:uncharacterized surface protein with fasciclin (FAS1) repeats